VIVKIPSGVNWLLWRPVHARLATRTEVAREWSLDDVLDANAILDAFDDAEAAAAAKARR
jgi:hypothetical protein